MKKSLVALAALAVAGIASAQSSVTLFGVVDATINGISNKTDQPLFLGNVNGLPVFGTTSVTTSQTRLTNSGYNSSRLGFRGTEDLGGGLAASFWLEAGMNNDDGTGAATGGGLNFNRRSTVSLSGNFGEVRLGRDYTPTFWNDTVFDPFGTNGVGTNLISTANGYSTTGASTGGFTANSTYVRASNSIGYFLPPNLGGFYGQVMYAFNEKNSYDPAGFTPPGAAAIVTNPFSFREPGADGYLIGATVPVGPGLIRVSYSAVNYKNTGTLINPANPFLGFNNDAKADKIALGYVHNLSKRTALYATVAYLNNKDGADLTLGGPAYFGTTAGTGGIVQGSIPKSSTGYDFGIRHAF